MQNVWVNWKIKKYERKLEAQGENPEYLYALACLYKKLSEHDAARKYYHQAITAYYQQNSRLGLHNEFIFTVCTDLLDLDATDILAHQTLGQEYCSLGEFQEAAKLYSSLAGQLMKAGQFEDALQQYRNVLVLFPEDIKIRQHCFLALWKLHRREDAVQELRKIAELAEQKGLVAKAVECYQKALKIMPAHTESQQELRRLLHTRGPRENQLRLVVNNTV
jgi:tetratricopeptide (TPR) repeat protein